MNETLKNENSIREYLLGRVSDETRLAEFEELLFLDEDFCSLAELAEDALINDFVFERLNETDSADFLKTLENNRERQAKIAVTKAIKEKAAAQTVAETETKPSFFESLKVFFQKPLNVGAIAVLLIAVVLISFFVFRKPSADELAELKTIYGKERPTETRLSEFDYAPLTVTRGAAEEREKNKLRIIENELRIAVEKNPSANTYHALGVFLLTQSKFDEAINELEKAVKLNENDAKIRNDLGSAYFEKAKTAPDEKKLETLAKALENFSRAVDSDANLLAALFNKALCLQELRLYIQAKDAWNLYLEKDKNSGWADEARKNLERLEQLKSTSKTKEQVLEDFLAAYRMRDAETVWKINSQTREIISGVWLPDQLSRRFIEAKIRGDDSQATESIEGLKLIGNLEQQRNADFFVAEMADFYSKTDKYQDLLKAKNLLTEGFNQIKSREIGKAKASFEESRNLFEKNGNPFDAKIAEFWLAHALSDSSEIKKSNEILDKLALFSKEKKYRWLFLSVSDWISNNYLLQNNLSASTEIYKNNLKLAEELSDLGFQYKAVVFLAGAFNEVGEYQKSLGYLSRNLNTPGFYNQSESRVWLNSLYTAMALYKTEMFETAESFGKEALFIVQNSDLKKSQADQDTFQVLLKIYKTKKDYPQAIFYAEESLRSAEKTQDESFKTKMIQYALLEIADLKREMQKFDESLSDYDSVIDLLQKTPEIQLDNYAAHKGKLLCLQQLGKTEEMQTELELLLALSEKYRTQILEDESRSIFFDNEQMVFDVAVENAIGQGNAEKAFDYAETSRARTLLDFMSGEMSVIGLEKKFPKISKPLSLAEIRQKMPPQTQLVVYSILPEKLVVWIVSSEKFDIAEKQISADDTKRKVADFLELIKTDKENSIRIKESSAELFDLLIAPILAKLDSAKEIVFVPDKSLTFLPFGVLFSKQTNKFLIEDFAVMHSPSASVFVTASETARRLETIKDESLLSIGNPKFDFRENPNLKDLPSAEIESREVSKFYRNNRQFIGGEATKSNILSELTEKNIFHFAGHYVTNEASAPNSKLLLANGDWRVSELTEMRLTKTKLVVLSACETAAEKFYQGEGAIGAGRTFLAIGVPLVLASSWKIDSEAAKDLMISFHRFRREKGLRSAEALRQAQISMLKGANPNYQTPYFWSAFSLVGGYANY